MTGKELIACFIAWRPGGYARDSVVTFGWLIARAAAQTVLTLVLARLLGAGGYGLFITALALVGFFVPLAGMGFGAVLLREGARQREVLAEYLRQALALWGPATLIFSLIATAVMTWALPTPIALPLLFLFAWSEIAASSLAELAARVAQAQQRMHLFGALQFWLLFVRLLAVVTIFWWPRSVELWLLSYAGANVLYLSIVIAKLIGGYRLKWPKFVDFQLIRAGFPFVVGAVSFRLQGEFNKPLLAQTSLGDAANFNIAQRVVDLLQLPLNALLESLWPRLYATRQYQRRLLLTGGVVVGFALLGGVVLAVAAPLLPLLLGADYATTVNLILVLAWLPAVQVVRHLCTYPLTREGRANHLTSIYGVGTSIGMVLTAYLVIRFGLTGALMAVYAQEVLLMALLLVRYRYFRER